MELSEVQKEADSAGRKAVVFGLFALVLSGVFGWMLSRLSGGGPEVQNVVVAAEEIPALSQIKLKQLRVVPWPKDALPQGTYASPQDVIKVAQVNVNSLMPGEPLLTSRLSTPDRGLGIAQMVEPNMRAFVVQVNESVATAQLLHPGAFVDVIATFEDPSTREIISKVLLQNIQVLAIGASIDVETTPQEKGASATEERQVTERHRVVTLLVGLDDVESLTFASREGKIDLALRSNMDDEVVTTAGATMEKVMGAKPKVVTGTASADVPHVAKPARPTRSHGPPPPLEPKIYRTPANRH